MKIEILNYLLASVMADGQWQIDIISALVVVSAKLYDNPSYLCVAIALGADDGV